MQLKSLTPMLWVDDIPATIEFYSKNLGFTCGNYVEEAGWAYLEKDGVEIMLALHNQHIPYHPSHFTGTFYFTTADVDVWWENLKDKVEIVYPLEDFEYSMREFAIRDNNGYILQFGQENS